MYRMTDVKMNEGESSGDEEVTKSSVSGAEEAALARKRRLLEMKSRMHGVEMKEEDYEKDETNTKKSKGDDKTFRSYQPMNEEVGKIDDSVRTNLRAVEDEIDEQLRLANDASYVDKIDLQALAPKKVHWDLKRDIGKKLDKLERRTQTAIADLIRQRLSEGKTNLAEAVASAQ